MNKKKFALLIVCLFFGTIIISACKDEERINPFKDANVGDYIKFGRYPQSAKEDYQPIEWQVLAKEENRMLVISKYGLTTKPFDAHSGNWRNSEIRTWLNGEFYNEAFYTTEQKNIKYVGDNIFLLSKEEAEKYFADDDARCCKATEYAIKKGAVISLGSFIDNNGYCKWWLRSISPNYNTNVYTVQSNGKIDYYCSHNIGFVVRPALWIKL